MALNDKIVKKTETLLKEIRKYPINSKEIFDLFETLKSQEINSKEDLEFSYNMLKNIKEQFDIIIKDEIEPLKKFAVEFSRDAVNCAKSFDTQYEEFHSLLNELGVNILKCWDKPKDKKQLTKYEIHIQSFEQIPNQYYDEALNVINAFLEKKVQETFKETKQIPVFDGIEIKEIKYYKGEN